MTSRLLLFSQLVLLGLFPTTTVWAKTNTGFVVVDGCVRGNGIVKTIERKASDFTILETSGTYDINITSGIFEQSIKITGDANLLPLIATDSHSNKLMIHPEKSICTEHGITVDINVGSLEALVASGSENVKVKDIATPKFALDMAGSSDVELKGAAYSLEATISGAGTLRAESLKTRETLLNISGTGTANVNASEKLNVDIIGVADVYYFGNPKKIEKNILGVGELIAVE